jgi:D-hexose-6-phosphate mutarotase
MTTDRTNHESKGEIPGRVTFLEGRGELPMVEISTGVSTAEVYRHGAHVTHFKKTNEPPLLFLSQCSRFAEGQPIRGGIPIVFPWFGPREGLAQHGFARHKAWDLREVAPAADGSVSIRFQLPDYPEASTFPRFSAEYVVTVKDTLTLQLTVANESQTETFTFENCLHTYFAVGDITAVSITGLEGAAYLDRTANMARKTEVSEPLRISSEVDRTYLDTPGTVEILDKSLGRRITIEKEGSQSNVVWNPWVARAQQMPDFGNDEFERMVCVESGNVMANAIKLQPGESSKLIVKLSTFPL